MKHLVVALTIALATPAVLAAHAERCDPIPQSEWRPKADLKQMLTDKGWKVSRVKVENGCYEVYGRDADNKKVEVFFYPKTFEVVTAPK